MTRDEVLAGYTGGGWDYPDVEGMADEIVRLRHELAVIRGLRTNTSTFATAYPSTFRVFNYCEVPTDELRSL